ncbi:hypothetical protein G7Y89_g2507 [Cudoniella acicularis]|uniref:T-complex protein 1 subunit gamma n=1 Tax=Cudoniella acicularis TaxID=354080 RepID=A0A8H4W8K3_9HELO|nr:hypothetical protein G7Y89_g2507 [Cudoniella acicularis]
MSYQPRSHDLPWAAPLSVDLLLKVLNVTFLHPFVAWMLPLCMRAQAMKWTHPAIQIAIGYASLLTALFFINVLNRQIAYSKPRKVDFSEEVIVITGGASGLGLLIAEVYGMRGATVAVLDVMDLESGEARGVAVYKCDVGDKDQVAKAALEIERDLGTPTILINNAAIVNGKPLLELSLDEIEQTVHVNLLSHFYTLKSFLPGMARAGHGTIVTVSSVIGQIGAAHLSDYAASKAAITAMHKSLAAELKSTPNIKTILVSPGQLTTPLFNGVRTPSSFFAPALEPVDVAKEVIATIDGGSSAELAMPLQSQELRSSPASRTQKLTQTSVADIIRSCLGPKAMLKMLLDPMGGIVLTNDGHAILREIEVSHPAAKSMIELSRTQDEEVGDGTTTVIILAGEILAQALPQLERNIHPVVIISAFKRALKDALKIVDEISLPVDIDDDQAMYQLISSSIGTKFVSRWSELMCNLALKAVRTVTFDVGGGKKEVDIKRYARVEKIPGGEIEDSRVLDGVMLNKDITHPKMRRRIENPRIILLDCTLEYKKGESQTNIEISKEEDWNKILMIEEEQVKLMCDAILALKPDLVITEKGVSDLAQHYLMKGNVTALRRVRKTDNNRVARATGATVVNRVDDLQESDVGTQCGLFEIEKIGDEYFTFLTKCKSPKACTILLRGPSKDILNEIDRNLADAMAVARNVMFHPRLSPGGGATEMAVAVRLGQLAKSIEGVQQWPYKAVAEAMEVIPRTLIQNAGNSPVRVLTELRAKHAEGGSSWGIDGDVGKLVDMKEYGVWEPEAVKLQSIKTAIESACLLLRVDDICSAKAARQAGGGGAPGGEE